jgi:hypothetical protein
MSIVNFELLKSPYNWATVIIMALFGIALIAIVSPETSGSDA